MTHYYFQIKIDVSGKKAIGDIAKLEAKRFGKEMYGTGDWIEADSKDEVVKMVEENWPGVEIVDVKSQAEVEHNTWWSDVREEPELVNSAGELI